MTTISVARGFLKITSPQPAVTPTGARACPAPAAGALPSLIGFKRHDDADDADCTWRPGFEFKASANLNVGVLSVYPFLTIPLVPKQDKGAL